VAKRLQGISKAAAPVLHGEKVLGPTPADKEKNGRLIQGVALLDQKTQALEAPRHVEDALKACQQIADDLERVFNETLVNDPADPLTPKRLELLSYGAQCLLRIADFSRLG
jgi:glycyl-tRNA synthetase beta chain